MIELLSRQDGRIRHTHAQSEVNQVSALPQRDLRKDACQVELSRNNVIMKLVRCSEVRQNNQKEMKSMDRNILQRQHWAGEVCFALPHMT